MQPGANIERIKTRATLYISKSRAHDIILSRPAARCYIIMILMPVAMHKKSLNGNYKIWYKLKQGNKKEVKTWKNKAILINKTILILCCQQ